MTVSEAIRELRKHLGKTQQMFATELGISISSLNNYERQRTPKPKQLLLFHFAAEKAGRPDLAQVFESSFRDRLMVPNEMFLTFLPDKFETTAIAVLTGCIRDASPMGRSTLIKGIAAILEERADPRRDRFIAEGIRRGLI
jgi:transcriptional regulator with XRE-family HTH domain